MHQILSHTHVHRKERKREAKRERETIDMYTKEFFLCNYSWKDN